jgi:multidrug efflux pump subunit AcrB/ABC-type multidrug transport system ATPase subunit
MLTFIIKRRVLVSMLFIGSTLLGYISYTNLNLELLPSVELPFLFVQVNAVREMDPGNIERQAVIPLEGATGTLEGIDAIESYIDQRQGRIIVYYNPDVNLKYAYLKLQEKVDEIKPTLSGDFIVTVLKIDTEQLANMFMNLQLRGSGDADRLRFLFENRMRDEFESVDGIANVEVFGGRDKTAEIVLDPAVSAAYDLTPSTIRSALARNSQDKLFLGRVNAAQNEIFVNLIGEFRDISDLENIVVKPEIPLLLRDVAQVNLNVKDETSISRVNGKEAVTIQLIRDTRVNLIDLSHSTRNLIAKLNKKMAADDVEIVIQQDSAQFLEDNLDLITNLALTGALIAVIILWFFLRNLKLVLVIALAMPISVFTAFNLFYAFDITLNSLTLVGMALAIGMLLDNSVVVLENIYRLYQLRRSAFTAVTDGTREVWRSIFAATLTTITVFLPFIFADNYMIRIIGYQIGISIISTLLVSLIVAMTLIPMLVYFLLEHGHDTRNRFQVVSLRNRLVQIYLLFLKSSMRFPLRTILGALIIFFVSVLLALALSLAAGTTDQSEDIRLYLTMPGGSTLETTDLATTDLEKSLDGIAEIKDVISQVYEEEASLTITLKDDYLDIENHTISDIKTIIEERTKNLKTGEASLEQPESGNRFGRTGRNPGANFERLLGIGGNEERLSIIGSDYEVMRRVANDIQYQLENLSSINQVRQNISSSRPEIHLLFDKRLMHQYNIPVSNLVNELSNFQNEISTGFKFRQGTNEYDIIIRDPVVGEKNYEDLRTLPIPSQTGAFYPLNQISQLVFTEGRAGINRVNQERQIDISYRFNDEINESNRYLEASREEVRQMLSGLEIPPGIAIQSEDATTGLSDFYFLIAVGAILIYMILAAVFESLLNPFIIMFTIPLAAIGSLWAIIFTGSTLLNANTLIGFLILLGIVVNNGIILIDYTRLLRQAGFRRSRALMNAGKARLRPILITALTTIAAMFPLAMGKVEYVTTIAAPFAITVIGGLSLSTLFTLVLIPTVYTGLESLVQWIKSLNPWLRILQAILFAAGAFLIYFEIESLIWQFANLILLFFIIPGITYFVLQSLRQAREDIAGEKDLTIHIQNLYKVYDRPARFIREWKKGELISRTDMPGASDRKEIILKHIWQYISWGFLLYFTYFYLESNFWIFILVHPVYFYSVHLLRKILNSFRASRKTDGWTGRVFQMEKIFIWTFPACNLALLYFRDIGITATIFAGVFWYISLIIYAGAHRLNEKKISIVRMRGLPKKYYQLIRMIPVIGRKTVPFQALKGVSLTIRKGMFGLLGPNGAGKTTLMRIICGILEQSFGTVHFNHIDARVKREELQGLIGYLPQDFGTYENMTARQFLNYQAILRKITDREERAGRIDHVIAAVHMEKHIDEKIGSYSGGMKQRIGIAQTLLHLPRVLVVDEPTAGLDPRERIRFRNLLVELSRERIVIFSTHIIEDIASSCDRVAVLNHGRLKYVGAPVKMTDHARGHVWQVVVSEERFKAIQDQFRIVSHIRLDKEIRVRILAGQKPLPEAKEVLPNLEDAYLWLLGDVKS